MVACSPKSLSLSRRKYVTDLLEVTDTLGSKYIDTPMDPNIHLIMRSRLLIQESTDD